MQNHKNLSMENTIIKIFYFICFCTIYGIFIFISSIKIKSDIISSLILVMLLIPLGLFIYNRYKLQLSNYNPNGFGKYKINIKIVYFIFIMLFTNLILDIILYSSIINKLDLSNFPSINYFFPSLFATLNTYICAPIFEELIFRVIFFNYFFNKNDKLYNILAIVVSSIIFGLMHGRNIIFLLV